MHCELPHFKQFPTRKCCGRSAPTQALPEATQAFIFLSWQAHSSTKIALYSLFILTSIMSALLVFTTQIEAKLALVWSSMDWYREPSIGMKLKCGTQAGSGVKQCTLHARHLPLVPSRMQRKQSCTVVQRFQHLCWWLQVSLHNVGGAKATRVQVFRDDASKSTSPNSSCQPL